MKIGLLLMEVASGREMGLIEFDPSGILVMRGFEDGVHVNALNAVIRLMENNGLNVPLYEKYAALLKEQSSLSAEVLEKEASHYVEVINNMAPAPQINGMNYRAAAVRYPR